MKSKYRVEVLVVAAGAALLAPVVSRASHPTTLPASARLAQTARAGTTTYQFTTIDAPGSSDTEAYGFNTPGLVTGFYLIQGHANGFIWQNGSITTADHPGALHTLLGDVNEPGLVIGNYGSFFLQHAAIYSIRTGAFTTLPDVPNLPMNFGNGINPQGIAVGSAAMGNWLHRSIMSAGSGTAGSIRSLACRAPRDSAHRQAALTPRAWCRAIFKTQTGAFMDSSRTARLSLKLTCLTQSTPSAMPSTVVPTWRGGMWISKVVNMVSF
jgi:hypothetical protein